MKIPLYLESIKEYVDYLNTFYTYEIKCSTYIGVRQFYFYKLKKEKFLSIQNRIEQNLLNSIVYFIKNRIKQDPLNSIVYFLKYHTLVYTFLSPFLEISKYSENSSKFSIYNKSKLLVELVEQKKYPFLIF
ncbi:MAG: hypothetical protein RMJ67_01070 [Elusimicrobiota bacterium]|nr:hypothetical protein [Endomicrobiia bacterium]MDW8165094.1 hypothetical protein [Elusimicrobiota bacterium]